MRRLWLSVGLALWVGAWVASPAMAMESINQMVDRLCRANGLPRSIVKQAIIQQSNQINAGTDGQNIVVYSGLWNQLPTDDARAFVVGHELGHIVLHHNIKATGRQIGFGLLSRLAGSYLSPIASTATFYGLQLTDLKFDRGQEYQADDEGLKLMWRAGYDPHAVNQVFAVLNRTDQSAGPPEFLRTHPLSKNRLDDLVAKYDRLGPPGSVPPPSPGRSLNGAPRGGRPWATVSSASSWWDAVVNPSFAGQPASAHAALRPAGR